MSKKPSPKFTSPDRKLDPAQFEDLNREFYQGFHQELILTRLGLLCVMHETPEKLAPILSEGVAWGELELRVEPDDGWEDIQRQNAELELVALRQHAAEVLFRVFWVHAHQDPCPWLALARFRDPGSLKKAADEYLHGKLWSDSEDRQRFHARAVWSSAAVTEDGSIKEQLTPSVENVCNWIAVAALSVKESPLYNAYKHGLAVVSSEPFTMSIGRASHGVEDISMSAGAGFKYISRGTDKETRRHFWQLAHEPVDFPAVAAETGAFATLMGTILDAGAFDRRVTPPPLELNVLNPEVTPDKVRSYDEGAKYVIAGFADSLRYFK